MAQIDPYPRNTDETIKANVEDSEVMVDPYPRKADETTEANVEDDDNI